MVSGKWQIDDKLQSWGLFIPDLYQKIDILCFKTREYHRQKIFTLSVMWKSSTVCN